MGHVINYYTTKVGTEKHLKMFLSEITEQAYDPQENSSAFFQLFFLNSF